MTGYPFTEEMMYTDMLREIDEEDDECGCPYYCEIHNENEEDGDDEEYD